MKRISQIQQWLCAAIVGLMACWSTSVTQATVYTNILVQSFDDGSSPAVISTTTYGVTGITFDWSEEDANEPSSSGSLLVTVPFLPTGGAWQEAQLNYPDPISWPGLAVPPYGYIEFDVRVLSGDTDTNGTYGGVQMVFQGNPVTGANPGNPSGVNWVPLGLVSLTSTNWLHVSQSLDIFQPYNLNQMIINFVAPNVTNTINYLVDNIRILVATNLPPTLSLSAPPVSGLHLVTPSSGNEFQRQNIRTIGTNFAWYGAGGPVTYSVTIGKYPNSGVYSNLETHIFLVPNRTPFNPDPDWANPSCLRLDVVNNNNGSGSATLRYKTNSPNSNGGYYGAGGITNFYPSVPGTNVLGTWSMTFSQNTNVTVTAPDGTSSNYVINTESAIFFNTNNLRVYFGDQAGFTNNLGQEVLLSGVSVSGAAGSVSDNFLGATLDTNKWQKAAQVPANVFQVLGSAYTLSWPVPDNLFTLVTATNLSDVPSPWQDSALSSSVSGGTKKVVVPIAYPSSKQGFFALVKRTATKLLVLLPGETYAPGTVAGKTGSPIAQTNNVGFQAVIKTVDNNNYQAFSTDTVYVETPGVTNTLSFAYVAQLVLGSSSFNVTNSTAGTWTIRALDTTDTNITEYVTGSYTVN